MPLADRHCPPNKDRVDLGASQQVQRAPKSTSVWAQSDSHPLPNWRVPGDLHLQRRPLSPQSHIPNQCGTIPRSHPSEE